MFQSPSLRGSGLFVKRVDERALVDTFQSPSLRGSGLFRLSLAWGVKVSTKVSIPFIAGQWSLRSLSATGATPAPCFNPLHCGAVVSSLAESRTKAAYTACFNPLHCGAVVSSGVASRDTMSREEFQSPSLRGSGLFHEKGTKPVVGRCCFNPLHCGAVVSSIYENCSNC